VLLFVNILSVIEVLVPRHGTNPLGCRALWHGTALPGLLSAVPGPEWWHGGTTRHGTVRMPCLIVPCLIVPCRAVLVPYRARAARLENFRVNASSRAERKSQHAIVASWAWEPPSITLVVVPE